MCDDRRVKTLADIARNRCPRCRQFSIWRGMFAMHPVCGVCGFRFERQAGYFIGAIYVSYTATTVLAFPIWFVMVFALDLSWWTAIATVAAMVVVLYPLIFRYSRVIWLYVDLRLDPPEETLEVRR